jgi:hypothetical protein
VSTIGQEPVDTSRPRHSHANPWLDAGPACVEHLPLNTNHVQTYSAEDLKNCALVYRAPITMARGFTISVLIDCWAIDPYLEDGGRCWTYSDKPENGITFDAELCEVLETSPATRIDVVFEWVS